MPAGSQPGERRGGRQPGTPNRNAAALRDAIAAEGLDPAIALVRIAKAAEAREDYALAVDAWGKVLPYTHARPRPVEFFPDELVSLEGRIAHARLTAQANVVTKNTGLADLAERMQRSRLRADLAMSSDKDVTPDGTAATSAPSAGIDGS